MLSGRIANLFTPTSVGALMDPVFLRRAVSDRSQSATTECGDRRGDWQQRAGELAKRWAAAAFRIATRGR